MGKLVIRDYGGGIKIFPLFRGVVAVAALEILGEILYKLTHPSTKGTPLATIRDALYTGAADTSMHTGLKKRVRIVLEAYIAQLLLALVLHVQPSPQLVLGVVSVPKQAVREPDLKGKEIGLPAS